MVADHLVVVGERRVGVLRLEALADVVERIGHPLARRMRAQQLGEAAPRRARAAEPQLPERRLVDLFGRGARRRRRGGRRVGRRLRDLLPTTLQLRAQLGQPALALAGQLAELHQLLLDAIEIVLHVPAQRAHGLPRVGEGVEHLLLEAHHLGDLPRALGVPPRLDVPHLRDLVLQAADVARGGAGPQKDQREGGRGAFHWGATRLSPPEITSNSSRRFWA